MAGRRFGDGSERLRGELRDSSVFWQSGAGAFRIDVSFSLCASGTPFLKLLTAWKYACSSAVRRQVPRLSPEMSVAFILRPEVENEMEEA